MLLLTVIVERKSH